MKIEKNNLLAKLSKKKKRVKVTKIQIKNRCIVTNYSRSVLRISSYCRHYFRKMASNGKMPGIAKASW